VKLFQSFEPAKEGEGCQGTRGGDPKSLKSCEVAKPFREGHQAVAAPDLEPLGELQGCQSSGKLVKRHRYDAQLLETCKVAKVSERAQAHAVFDVQVLKRL